jgi:hypothetical protein
MYSLLCKPIIVPPQNILTTKVCRIVTVTPSKDVQNKYELEIVENAPPVNVEITEPE